MDRGSINTRIIKRSILKHIARTEPVGTTVGTDYSIVDRGTSPFAIITAQGFSQFSGEMAFIRALNNLAAGGAKADSIMIDVMAGSTCTEDRFRKEMNQLSRLASKRILGLSAEIPLFRKLEGMKFHLPLLLLVRWKKM